MRIEAIGDEVAVTFKLEAIFRLRFFERRFQPGFDDRFTVRVKIVEERAFCFRGVTFAAATGCGADEQPVVEADFSFVTMRDRNPVQIAFDLDAVGSGGAALGFRQIFAMYGDDIAGSILVATGVLTLLLSSRDGKLAEGLKTGSGLGVGAAEAGAAWGWGTGATLAGGTAVAG